MGSTMMKRWWLSTLPVDRLGWLTLRVSVGLG